MRPCPSDSLSLLRPQPAWKRRYLNSAGRAPFPARFANFKTCELVPTTSRRSWTMKFQGLKKLEGQQVNLWPRPLVMPGASYAKMQWCVRRIDRKDGVVELHAPSGHFFNAADVVHHFQHQGQWLILDAQLVIRGNEIELLPQRWGATFHAFRRVPTVIARPAERRWGGLALMGFCFLLGAAAGGRDAQG